MLKRQQESYQILKGLSTLKISNLSICVGNSLPAETGAFLRFTLTKVTSATPSLRKVSFRVSLESPSEASDQVAFVSAVAFRAKGRLEHLDHFGDRQRIEACDLGRRCSVHA